MEGTEGKETLLGFENGSIVLYEFYELNDRADLERRFLVCGGTENGEKSGWKERWV